jgi:cell division protein FtsW
MNFKKWFWSIDKNILSGVLFLVFIGTITIIKISSIMALRFGAINEMSFVLKHFFFIGLGIFFIFFLSYLSWQKTRFISYVFFTVMLILNFLTIIIGPSINGVHRWINIGGFSFQSSEFVKTLIVMPSAYFLSTSQHRKNILLIGVSAFSCVIQPDLGMTFLIISISSVLALLKNENLKEYFKVAMMVLGAGVISGIFLAKYAFNRLLIFLGKKQGFQISQTLKKFAFSKILGESSDYIYVPDSHCDFIFAELSATFGIVISLIVIIIPFFIFISARKKISHYMSEEKILIVLGIISQFCIQSFFHILSNLGLVPTKGLNLPFVSIGGSNLLAYSFSFGILLCLTKKTTFLDEVNKKIVFNNK